MSLGGVYYNAKPTFINKKSTDEYIDSAIARNIQHSLKYYQDGGHFRALEDLFERNELTGAINRIVEDMNHKFTIEVLTRDFTSHDLGVSARNLRSDRECPTDVLDHVNKIQVTKRLKELLEIKNKEEQSVKITDAHRREIKEYLDLLDLTVDIDIEWMPPENVKKYRTVFTQPGMRYSQANDLIRSLLLDETFRNLSATERQRISDRILDEINGRMLEDIVLLETKLTNAEKMVFRLQFAVGEFDMVVVDPEKLQTEIYEIKYSKEALKEQAKHLTDEKKCKDTAFRFGEITKKVVLYRGVNTEIDGIQYQNVEEYLSNLK